jgi:hypothetical protein
MSTACASNKSRPGWQADVTRKAPHHPTRRWGALACGHSYGGPCATTKTDRSSTAAAANSPLGERPARREPMISCREEAERQQEYDRRTWGDRTPNARLRAVDSISAGFLEPLDIDAVFALSEPTTPCTGRWRPGRRCGPSTSPASPTCRRWHRPSKRCAAVSRRLCCSTTPASCGRRSRTPYRAPQSCATKRRPGSMSTRQDLQAPAGRCRFRAFREVEPWSHEPRSHLRYS